MKMKKREEVHIVMTESDEGTQLTVFKYEKAADNYFIECVNRDCKDFTEKPVTTLEEAQEVYEKAVSTPGYMDFIRIETEEVIKARR